jgi:hypothetical protein
MTTKPGIGTPAATTGQGAVAPHPAGHLLSRVERSLPDVAVAAYAGTGAAALVAGAVIAGVIPHHPVLLRAFHYGLPALALIAGAATALAPSPRPRVLRELFWTVAGAFALMPAFWALGLDLPLAGQALVRFGIGSLLLLGSSRWLSERRAWHDDG